MRSCLQSVWHSINIRPLTALSFLLFSEHLEQFGEDDDEGSHLYKRRPWLWAWLDGGQPI